MSETPTVSEHPEKVIAAWLHEVYGGKIGYCYHEGGIGYRRCDEDAKLLVGALEDKGFEVAPSTCDTCDRWLSLTCSVCGDKPWPPSPSGDIEKEEHGSIQGLGSTQTA